MKPMSDHLKKLIAPVAMAIIAGFAVASLVSAQPGGESDPVVSLSYLQAELAYVQVLLEGGEEIGMAGGRGIVLVEGSCRLRVPPDSGWLIIDVTSGETYGESLDMMPGHFYLPVAESGPTERYTLQAWQRSTVVVPGSAGS